ADGEEALPRLWQAVPGVDDDVDLHLLLAVPDHLGGQPAGRDLLVPAPHPERLGGDRRDRGLVSLRAAVRAAAVARLQAAAALAGPACRLDAADAPGGPVLAGRAGLRGRRRQPAAGDGVDVPGGPRGALRRLALALRP